MKQWIVSMALFLAVFVCCMATILSPVKLVSETTNFVTGAKTTIKQADFIAMGKNWRENPNYFITVGITAFLSLAGAGFSVYMIDKETKGAKDEEGTA